MKPDDSGEEKESPGISLQDLLDVGGEEEPSQPVAVAIRRHRHDRHERLLENIIITLDGKI